MNVNRICYNNLWLIIGLFTIVIQTITSETVKYDDNIAEESFRHNNNNHHNNDDDDDVIPSYILPNNIFNNGKPFYGFMDPTSGLIDFNQKKNNGNNLIEQSFINNKDFNDDDDDGIKDVNTNDISQISTNFHDYLNLPVKYTASKFVYPLVSSSYSNLKYQGNNKNFTSNHKNYTTTPTIIPTTTTTTTPTTILPPSNIGNTRPKLPMYTTKQPSYTLKPRPITTSPMKFSPSTIKPYRPTQATTPIKLLTYPKETSTTLKPTTTSKIPTTTQRVTTTYPSTTTTTTTTIRTPKPPSPMTSSTSLPTIANIRTTQKPLTTVPQTTFKPIPTLASQTTSGTMTLADLFNSLGVEDTPSNIIPSFVDNEHNSIIELNVNSLNGPTNPQNVNIPPTIKQNYNNNNNNFNGIQNSPQPSRNDYVKYEIQGNQNNMQQYPSPVSSMNNIVISPDQNSAAFVLGSQQSVGSGNFVGSKDTTFINSPGPQYQLGTILNENSFTDFKPQGFTAQNNYNNNNDEDENKQQHKTSNNVRFPIDLPSSYDNVPIVQGIYKNEIITQHNNGHSAPIALPQNQIVVFPPNEKMPIETVNSELHLNLNEPIKNNRVVFEQNPTDILQLNSPPNFHQLPEDLTPPFEDKYIRGPNHGVPPTQMRPPINNNNNRIPLPSQYGFNEYLRKPIHRPMPDRQTLPNILPQFRPNAKASHGHPYNKEVGPPGPQQQPPQQQLQQPPPFRRQNTEIMPPLLSLNGRPPMQSQQQQSYNQIRRTQNPNRFLNKMAPAMPIEHIMEQLPNRRYYRVPPQQHQQQQINDRIYSPPPVPNLPPRRYIDGYPLVPPMLNQQPQQPQQQQQHQYQSSHISSKSDNLQQPFESDDFYKNPPAISRHPIEDTNSDQQKMEPVVTLQMIQSKKILTQDSNNNGTRHNLNENDEPLLNNLPPPVKNPLYVVYPIKSSSPMKLNVIPQSNTELPVVIGQRGDHPPLPPNEISGSPSLSMAYQNTPFTIVHNEQIEPILMAKDRPITNQFPYQLIKQNPLTIAELDQSHNMKKGQLTDIDIYNIGESPADAISKVINSGGNQHNYHIEDDGNDEDNDDFLNTSNLGTMTRKPIAIAYTPTEPPRYYNNHYQQPQNHQQQHQQRPMIIEEKYSMPNFGGPIISEILDQEQPGVNLAANNNPHHINHHNHYHQHSYDRDELGYPSHYQQDFQAPFFPSVNADNTGTIKNSYEGWSVVTPTSTSPSIQKNQINRSDNTDTISRDQDENPKSHDRDEAATTTATITTTKFNADKFQPEFESGFRPIISSSPVKLKPIESLKKSTELEDSLEALFSDEEEIEADEEIENTTNNYRNR